MIHATVRAPRAITHSLLACFRSCPRKTYLRYELGIRSDRDAFPLRVGSGFARAVEADAKGLDVSDAISAGLEDPFDLALVAAMFDGHRRRWEGQGVEHVASELAFDIPLVNPETGKPTPNWRLQGVIDRLVLLPDGRLALMEYKTTSKDFAPGADYWTRLHLDMQLSIYLIAARALGYDVSTILYDVTRRPALRPALATPEADRKYTLPKYRMCQFCKKDKRAGAPHPQMVEIDGQETRVECEADPEDPARGRVCSDPGNKPYAWVRLTDEAPDEFAARCAESIAADPDKHYARIEIARLDADLDDARAEIWQQQIALREAQKIGRWYRNPEACFQLNSACEYVGICQSRDLETRTPDGFKRVDDVHAELTRHAPGGGQSPHATAGVSQPVTE